MREGLSVVQTCEGRCPQRLGLCFPRAAVVGSCLPESGAGSLTGAVYGLRCWASPLAQKYCLCHVTMISPTDEWLRWQHQELQDTEHLKKAWAMVSAWVNSYKSFFFCKKESHIDKIPFLSFCNPLFMQIRKLFWVFVICFTPGMRPRASCMLGKHSMRQAAPHPRAMCVCDKEWISGGKWKQEIFLLLWLWITMTFKCKTFRESYRICFCPVLNQPYK